MGLEEIYDPKLAIMYPEQTDAYVNGIPAEETFRTPDELAKNPSQLPSYIRQSLEANQDSLRQVELGRRAIAFRASIMAELILKHGDLLTDLPEEVQEQVKGWASRIESQE